MIHLYTNSAQEDTQVNTTYARPVENNASRVIKATDFAMSITGSNGGVSAYEGQGQNLQDIMKNAGAMDVTANRNYMTVMSNSMSDEDYEQLIKEGYKPGETSIETTVTVTDEIKAKLAQSGVIVEGYNDDLSDEVLQEITGSESAANAIKKAFHEADIPMTAKNVQSAAEALQLAGEIPEITDGMCDYLLRNGIDPTIDHLYRVRFSGAEVSENMGGYYSDDIGGYMTKQSSEFDWKSMEVRLSQTIERAGLPVNDETLKKAQWLVKSGILFNETNIKFLNDLKGLQMPMAEEDVAKCIANAIADGREAKEAYLNNTSSKLTEAVQAYEDVQSFSFEAVKVVVEGGKSLNIKELRVAMQSIRIEGTVGKDGVSLSVEASSASVEAVSGMSNLTEADVAVSSENPDLIKAMRILEETRLAMTIENNYRLMKLGYNIETTELSQLVEDLKAVEAQRQNTLFPKDAEAAQKATLWQATNDKLVTLAFMPAATVGKIVQTEGVHTLSSVHDMGEAMRQDYLKAGEQYELLSTEVRADLGDSIKKAFNNVDDILKDLKFDINDTNRRAVRILGYNSMEVTVSNIESVRDADAGLQRIMNKMTPASTLQLIRDGINPLETDLTTLENQLDAYETTIEQTAEKYSKFLFKLEKNHEITPEERESYIGIYRLLHQIEKSDGALVGNVLSQGAEMTFKNLLSAMRSGKSTGMDYSIDDSFGNLAKTAGYEFNISDQILKGFESAVIGSDEVNAEVLAEDLGELREILTGDNSDAVEELMHYNQEVTPDNIQSMQMLLKAPDTLQGAWSIFQNVAEDEYRSGKSRKNTGEGLKEGASQLQATGSDSPVAESEISALEEAVFALQDAFTDQESVTEAYAKLLKQTESLIEESILNDEIGRIDIKSMTSAYKQLSFTGNLMREENYEIPAYINGKLQGIRVKIVHKGKNDGNVIATLSTEKYGNIVAQFRLTEEKVQGYIACDSEEGTEALKADGRFEDKLAEAGKEAGDIRYLYSEKLDGTFLYRRHDKSVEDGGSTRDLYETAKLFILSMQDTER
ncbi:MAG: hypothetical protein E7284_11140 [Lachnospiraceae bacterium]|nr:hypothetical protein [Lachnospiraceae bacterium]